MKKSLLFAAAALVALAACTKESPVKEEGAIDASKLVFNIQVENADAQATKGIKKSWEAGDDVYVFFEDNTTQYVKMTYDGSAWSYADKDGGTTFSGLSLTASGKKLSAVYIPDFVLGSAKPGLSGSEWTFGDVSGYFQSACTSYEVSSTSDVNTLSATISLAVPGGSSIVQLFIPASEVSDPETGSESVLTATHVINYSLSRFVPGEMPGYGTVLNGHPMKGYKGTLGGETGYYFWGVLESNSGTFDFDFQLVKRNAEKKYAISSKSKTATGKTLNGSTAIKLTGLTDNGNFVDLGFGDCLWATGNLGRTNNSAAISNTNYKIADPLEAGDYFQWGAKVVYNTSTYNDQWTGTTYEDGLLPKAQDVAYQVNTSWRIPTQVQFDALISNTTRKWVTGWTNIGSTKGGRFITSNANGISLFLAAAGYYFSDSLRYAGDNGDYWSSTPNGSDAALLLVSDSGDIHAYGSNDRRVGYPVRPVKSK